MKKAFVVLLCLVMLLALVPASADDTVTLRFSWWGGDSRAQATLAAIDLYTQQNPNVTIEAEYTAFSGYYQKLVTQLASGNAPDFYQVDQGWVAELNARGNAFADMGQFGDVINTGTISAQMLDDYCIKGGKLVVLPLGYNGTVFLYNKTLLKDYLDADGELKNLTWDEFYAIGAALHAKDPGAYMTVAVTDGYVRYILKPILEQITNAISVQDDFTLGFTVDQMAQAFTIFSEVFTSGTAQPYAESVVYDSMQNNPLWLNGKIGGEFLFFSNVDTEIGGLDYDWGVAALPRMEGALTSGQESGPSLMVAINSSSDSAKQQEAAKFINWMINDPEASMILKTERGVPASSTALQTLTENHLLSDLKVDAIEVSNATVGFKNGDYEMDSSIHAIFVEKMEQVIYGVSTPEEAAQQLYDELTQRLAEMKQSV